MFQIWFAVFGSIGIFASMCAIQMWHVLIGGNENENLS